VSLQPVSPSALRGRLLWLAVGLYVVFATFGAAPIVSSPASAVTGAVTIALLAALTFAWWARSDAAVRHDPRPARIAFRARIEHTAFLPERDPDASGKPRPRAPGH
jgi:hypothetical protein